MKGKNVVPLIVYDVVLLMLLIYGLRRDWFRTRFHPSVQAIERRVKDERSLHSRMFRQLIQTVIALPLCFVLLGLAALMAELSAQRLEHWPPLLTVALFLIGWLMSTFMIATPCWIASNRIADTMRL